MRCLSLVVIGLTFAATTASAEPLRLAEMDLDRVTVDVPSSSVVAWVVEVVDDDGVDTDDNVIRILTDAEIALLGIHRTTDLEHDEVDHAVAIDDVRPATAPVTTAPVIAVRVSPADAGNGVGGSDAVVLRNDTLAGIGVIVVDRGAVAGNDASATGTSIVNQQVVVRATSTVNGPVVQTISNVTRTGNADSSRAVSSGRVQGSLLVRNDSTGSASGIRAASLLAGNGNPSLLTGRLGTGAAAGRLSAPALAGGSATSLLSSGFN